MNQDPHHIPPHHYVVAFRGGPLDGRIRPIYDKTYEHEGWRHGVPSRGETGNGGVIWSYAHRWPTACPRYVLSPGDPITAEWRPITDAEFDEGQELEAQWRHWVKVLHPLSYAADAAFFARKSAERRGVTDPDMLYLAGCQAVIAMRRRYSRNALESYMKGDAVPDAVQYLCDVRGNLQVRLFDGRSQWFQPAEDSYTAYPDRHVWIPPVRYTSALLARGPLTVVAHDFITDGDRAKLDTLRNLALSSVAAANA